MNGTTIAPLSTSKQLCHNSFGQSSQSEAEPDVKIYRSHCGAARSFSRAFSRGMRRQKERHTRPGHVAEPRSADGESGHHCAACASGRSHNRHARHNRSGYKLAVAYDQPAALHRNSRENAAANNAAHHYAERADNYYDSKRPVSYTHLTLPTSD